MRYIIGIDPGSVKTGLAIWDSRDERFTHLEQFDAHCHAILWLHDQRRTLLDAFIRIEDARLSKLPTALQKSGRSQGAGYVKALSKDWEMFARYEGVPYEMVSPQAHRYKKISTDLFRQMTGITTKIGQDHIRDAAMLVFKIRK